MARSDALGRIALGGVMAGGAAQIGRIFIQFASIAIMSRLLTPSQFGLVAMATAVIGVADLLREMGLSTASIQAQYLSEDVRNNLWWVNTLLGAAATALVALLGPVIAAGYGDSRLTLIVVGLSPMFLINGMTAQLRVSLVRSFQFNALARLDVIGQLIGTGVAIALAVAGCGYWALVGQQVLGPFLTLILVQRAAGWMPTRPRRGVGTMHFLRFGWAVFGSSVLTYFALSFDSMVIGRLFGAQASGLYSRAGQLVRNPLRQVAAPINSVLLPVMAKVQDDDVRLSHMARRVQLISTLPFLLVVIVLSASGRQIAEVFLGPAWLATAPIMLCIAIQSAFRMLSAVGAEIMTSRELGRQLTTLAAVTMVIDVIAVIMGVHWGLMGVAVAVASVPLFNWVFSFLWVGHYSGIAVGPLVRQGFILVAACAVAAVLARILMGHVSVGAPVVHILLSSVLSAVLITPIALVPSIRADLGTALRLVTKRA